jgi:hypothetical protein
MSAGDIGRSFGGFNFHIGLNDSLTAFSSLDDGSGSEFRLCGGSGFRVCGRV